MPRGERPLEAGDGPLLRFAAGLRKLRNKAGSPVYRQMAENAHYSVSMLSEAAAGRRLPTLEVTLAYVCACGGDPLEWERIWRETAAEMDVPEQPAVESGQRAPYAGLAAFRTEDAEWFFGRERLVAQVLQRLRGQRFVVVIGASGSGKSSLLRAGPVPELQQQTVVFTPGPRPLEECAIQLASLAGGTPGRWYEDLSADPVKSTHVGIPRNPYSDQCSGLLSSGPGCQLRCADGRFVAHDCRFFVHDRSHATGSASHPQAPGRQRQPEQHHITGKALNHR